MLEEAQVDTSLIISIIVLLSASKNNPQGSSSNPSSHLYYRCVLRGLHGPPGDQPNGNRADCASGAQAGPADPRAPLGEVPGAGESSGPLLHSQEAPPLLQTVLPGLRPGALQRQQLWDW